MASDNQDNDMIDDVEESKSNDKNFDNFSDHMHDSLYQQNKNANLILSPLSILVAMTVCMAGSAKGTLKEMMAVLYPQLNAGTLIYNSFFVYTVTNNVYTAAKPAIAKKKTKEILALCDYYNKAFGTRDKAKPTVKLANKIWIKQGFEVLDSYKLICRKENVESIDISNAKQAAKLVNDWCAKNTNNMIKKVVSSATMKDMRLLIANAIYFHGKFMKPFPKMNTMKETKFWADKARTKEVSKVFMMHQFEKLYFRKRYESKNADKGKYDVVKLRYKGSDLSLILALNKYSTRKQQLLKDEDLKSIKWKFEKLKLYVPRFKFEFELELKETLKKMGIEKAFNNKADFSRMTGDKELKIDKVIHKAVIEVDEEGTKAAAVTVVKMAKKKSKRKKVAQPPTIRMDHPFSFYIFDEKNGVVLFCGVYNGKK